jgi:hypothetical protein
MIHFQIKCLIILFTLLFSLEKIHATTSTNLSKSKIDSLVSQTNKLIRLDQKYRWNIMLGVTDSQELTLYMNGDYEVRMKRIQDNSNHLFYFDSIKMNRIILLQDKIDSNNTAQIKNMLQEYGVIANKDFISNLNILLLHFDKADLEQILPILYEAVISKKYPSKYYAENHDRYMELKKEPLVYCYGLIHNNKTNQEYPIIPMNIDLTNKYRKEIGLKKYSPNYLKYERVIFE